MSTKTTGAAGTDGDAGDAAASRGVKSAERALRILEILGEVHRTMTVTELHRQTGYPRSSLHGLLHTLVARRWIELSDNGGTVSIGTEALVVGTSYLDHDEALPYATSALEGVRDAVGYTTHYARLDDDSVLYLATRETSNSHRRTSRVGRKLPAHATSLGKALLSQLTVAEREAAIGHGPLVALTASTVTDRDELNAQLDEARSRGYSIEREENTAGTVCIGVPVRYRIPATDAISCALPVEKATDAEIRRVAGVLVRHSQMLADELQRAGVR